MRTTRHIRPEYIERFSCIGAACDDSCCNGWVISIDKATYKKYQKIPAGPLRTLIDENLRRTPKPPEQLKGKQFAEIQLLSSKACPMHNADKLCQIQVEHGSGYLSEICSSFPRNSFTIDELTETTLTLSCPEACRVVLLDGASLTSPNSVPTYMTWEDGPGGKLPPLAYFWPIREFVVNLVRNRDYPLWQRLFLLGTFSRRLEAVFDEQGQGSFSALERGYSQAISVGSLRDSIESIPANDALQLRMVLGLAAFRVDASEIPERISALWEQFMKGTGGEGDSTFEEQCASYAGAYQRYYAPFFSMNPHMLENLLLNRIFRKLFPFGPKFFKDAKALSPTREYARLVVEFALIKGLLIGVAGFRKEEFSDEDVVRTVQVVMKYFEHNAVFMERALEFLTAQNLDNAHGLTMLLRN